MSRNKLDITHWKRYTTGAVAREQHELVDLDSNSAARYDYDRGTTAANTKEIETQQSQLELKDEFEV